MSKAEGQMFVDYDNLSKEKRPRKPAARATEIVLAVIEERLRDLPVDNASCRLCDLFDELKRSLKKGDAE